MRKTNAQKMSDYRQRLRANPERWAAYLVKQAEWQRNWRKNSRPQPKTPAQTAPSRPTPEEHAALLAAFDESTPIDEPIIAEDAVKEEDEMDRIRRVFGA